MLRLQRLLALREAHATHLNAEGRHLLDHVIFTTFVDCRELGAETLALALLGQDGMPPGEVAAAGGDASIVPPPPEEAAG